MARLNRKDVDKYSAPVGTVWANQFSELRQSDSQDLEKQMHVELATQLLFNPLTYFRDSDLLCTPTLQKIMMDAPDMRKALTSGGVILFGLRDEDNGVPIESYTDLNRIKGRQGRAYPENFEQATAFCKFLDDSIESMGIHVATVKLGDFPKRLARNVERLIESKGEIGSRDQTLISVALSKSIERYDAAVFSKMIRILKDLIPEEKETQDRAIQLIRIAHNVAEHTSIKDFRISVENSDINPAIAAIALGRPLKTTEGLFLGNVAPKRILNFGDLQKVPWQHLSTIHSSVDAKNYFTAHEEALVAGTQFGTMSKQFQDRYLDYFRALELYMERIGVEGHVELIDWQNVSLLKALSENEAQRMRLGHRLMLGVLVSANAIMRLFSVDPFGFGFGAIGLSEKAKSAGEYLHKRANEKRTNAGKKYLQTQSTTFDPPR